MPQACVVPGLSVIIPCFNEEQNVEALIAELRLVLDGLDLTSEILVVDDASTDATPEILRRLAASVPNLRVLRHARNQRESVALVTGLEHARGSLIATMDADLQHDPAYLPLMLEQIRDADAVCPVRPSRAHPPLKRFSSAFANAVRSCCFCDQLADTGYAFRMVRREAIEGLPLFRGLHRFLPALIKLHGFRVVQPVVPQRPRVRGRSNYGVFNRLVPGLLDLGGMIWYRWRLVPRNRF